MGDSQEQRPRMISSTELGITLKLILSEVEARGLFFCL
jgi:hypothetical protein